MKDDVNIILGIHFNKNYGMFFHLMQIKKENVFKGN